MDMRLVEIDQPVLIALGAVQQAAHLLDEAFPPFGIGTAEQLLGLLARQVQPVQGSADGLARAETGEPRPHEADQALKRPARLRISSSYRWAGCCLLGRADLGAEGCLDPWAKGGRPPVRQYASAAGPCSLYRCIHFITVCG